MKIEYFIKGLVLTLGEAFCFNVLLPFWYLIIKITGKDDI